MTGVYDDRYWTQEFRITVADLERLAQYIREAGQAQDLTALARRVVRGRLRHGPEDSAPVQAVEVGGTSVRLWDPAGTWREKDHAIVALYVSPEKYEPQVAEIMQVSSHTVRMFLASLNTERSYATASPGSDQAIAWHKKVRDVVAQMRAAEEEKESVDAIVLEYGEQVASQLLNALQDDKRFMRLAGRWYLVELASLPTEAQIATVAWAMLPLEEPALTEDLLQFAEPALTDGDAGLFGLYLALRGRPETFVNTEPEQRPRWALSGPPPGSFKSRLAAYDPETFEVLCVPGQKASAEAVKRLWELDLLRVLV